MSGPFISVQMTLIGRNQYSASADLLTNKLDLLTKLTYKRISQKLEMNGTEGFEVEGSCYWHRNYNLEKCDLGLINRIHQNLNKKTPDHGSEQ